jgi:hypothetical protein
MLFIVSPLGRRHVAGRNGQSGRITPLMDKEYNQIPTGDRFTISHIQILALHPAFLYTTMVRFTEQDLFNLAGVDGVFAFDLL